MGEKISFLLKNKGLTPEDLANKVGVSRQQVYKWINGRSQPRIKMVHKIASVVGVEAGELLDNAVNGIKETLLTSERLIHELEQRIKLLEKLLAACEAQRK